MVPLSSSRITKAPNRTSLVALISLRGLDFFDSRLNAGVDKFLKTDDGVARLRKLGAEPAGGSPEDMQAYVLSEIDKWGKVAKFAGIKPE